MKSFLLAVFLPVLFILLVGIQSSVFAESDDGSCPFKGEKGDHNNSTGYSEKHESNSITNTYSSEYQIPSWLKSNAKWWASGQMDDSEFANGIRFLIDKNIISVSDHKTTHSTSLEIQTPYWIKTTAGWWADGLVSDTEFVSGLEHLVNNGII